MMATTAAPIDRILAAIDPQEVIDFARTLGEVPSQCGIDDEGPVADVMATKLRAAGLEVDVRDVFQNRPNVIGWIRGEEPGRRVQFNGHIDTMPLHMNPPVGHEARIEDGLLKVHGIRNMKAGVAAMSMAAIALKRAEVRVRGELCVAGVMGHHDGGIGTHALLDQGIVPEHAIVPEPTALNIRTMQTGSVSFVVDVIGKTGPAGGASIFEAYGNHESIPVDAIEEALSVIRAIRETSFSFEPDPRIPDVPIVHLRRVIGGSGPGYLSGAYVADRCTLTITVMTVPGQTPESVRGDLERQLAAYTTTRRGVTISIDYAATDPAKRLRPPLELDPDCEIAQITRRRHMEVVGSDTNVGAVVPYSYFGCDAQLLWSAGADAISYGPGDHAYVDANRGVVKLTELIDCTKVMALAAYDLLGAH
jgi:acetylornithine deacetylase/succinyl-diaminopimelate desuccinylase-like protein